MKLKKKKIVISILVVIILIASVVMIKKDKTINLTYGTISTSTVFNNNIFIDKNNYEDVMNSTVKEELDKLSTSGYFNGANDLPIYYEMYKKENSKGTIVISHGYSEYLDKYDELIYYFTSMGYSVFAMEHRGHGNSGNLGIADSSQIYVEDFDYYVEDFKKFIDEIVNTNKEEDDKLFLYAHSMGGGIGTLFLERYPEYFDAAVLNAPMLEIDTGNFPEFIAKTVALGADIFGFDGTYILGKGPYEENYDLENSGTSSAERYDYVYNNLVENEIAQRGDGAFKWLNEAFKATSEATSKKNASKVAIPVILFQAGNDTYVRPGGQDEFAAYAQNCKIIKIDDAKHEMYRESDDILLGYLNTIFAFYEENLFSE